MVAELSKGSVGTTMRQAGEGIDGLESQRHLHQDIAVLGRPRKSAMLGQLVGEALR